VLGRRGEGRAGRERRGTVGKGRHEGIREV